MFPYTVKYTESEYDIPNNNLLYKIHQQHQHIFEQHRVPKLFEKTKKTAKREIKRFKSFCCYLYKFYNPYFVTFVKLVILFILYLEE